MRLNATTGPAIQGFPGTVDLGFRELWTCPRRYCVPTNGHIATGATTPHRENARYGRHVWLCHRDDAWRMDGLYGQFSVMLPHHQACVTTTAHYQGPTTDMLDAIWSDIVPVLS